MRARETKKNWKFSEKEKPFFFEAILIYFQQAKISEKN